MKTAFPILVTVIATSTVLAQPQSPSFVLQQTTANGGGESCASTSFAVDGSAGQEATIGTSSSPRFVLQSGFWSHLGSSLVPVILMADKNGSNPDWTDLSWSGNNSPYQVYGSGDCSDVFGNQIATESGNAWTDSLPTGNLFCYSVLATAPGPMENPETGLVSSSTSGFEVDPRAPRISARPTGTPQP